MLQLKIKIRKVHKLTVEHNMYAILKIALQIQSIEIIFDEFKCNLLVNQINSSLDIPNVLYPLRADVSYVIKTKLSKTKKSPQYEKCTISASRNRMVHSPTLFNVTVSCKY